jgi:diguanylate cyclase (GGDEF)-like protein/PAS domain S-box-containing protein
MKLLFQEASKAEYLYRLILDNALDAFIAIDLQGNIIEWSAQAEAVFGWKKGDVLDRPLHEVLIPERYRAAHLAGLKHYRASGEGKMLRRRVETVALHEDGSEIPVELTITPIEVPGRTIFFASLRNIAERKALEEEIDQHAGLTLSVLNSMADAVVVVDPSEHLVMINPAGQRLLRLQPPEISGLQPLAAFPLYQADGETLYPYEQRPLPRALRGEHVNSLVARIRHPDFPQGVWISANARPLKDRQGKLVGAVAVLRDITELRRREEEAAAQTRLLQEQASLLDLSHDAIFARTTENVITYWNRSAETLYEFSRAEAIGRISHEMLRTRFLTPLEEIRAALRERHYWEGELVHTTRSGREITVFSQWALDFHEGRPYRYLETNADITQQLQTERALKRSQQDYRLLVESADHAIMLLDPVGTIRSWNSGAERILGLAEAEAIGRPISSLFTAEDRGRGEPLRELEEARRAGRSEDDRWHLRRDGSRFWATGVVTPLWNDDGSLRGFAKIMRDQTTQRLAEEQTLFLANHDALTGLPNRVSFSNRLHQSLALSQRNDTPMAVLLLDLDRFKQVNDTFGHHVGDLLLKEVALRIVSSIRETDFVARLGGDEFVVIQSDVSQPEASETLARKLILELGRPYQLDGQEIVSGASIGVSFYPSDAKNSVELLKRADLALYRAKDAGRHTYQIYTSELFSEQAWKKNREAALRGALAKHQFELHYQPQIDLASWKMSSVEALLRWRATEREMILPGEFLLLAEETGLIVEIGEWALREACHQVRRWQGQGLSDLRLSVNCSARQFGDPRFVAMIPSVLRDVGITPDSLELEVPEAMLAQHPEIKAQLTELRALGIRISIDNFGTGTTALMDFQEFEIDVLKIDKAFVQHLPHRREDSAITSAIISLAHNLGINVVAGGVETAEQLAYLKARDCTSAQGFIFSPPVPAEEFEQLLLSGSWSRINRAPAPGDIPVGSTDLH